MAYLPADSQPIQVFTGSGEDYIVDCDQRIPAKPNYQPMTMIMMTILIIRQESLANANVKRASAVHV